jgi:hypothetical protein
VTLLLVGCVLEGCPGDEYAKVSPYVEPWSQARLDEIYLDACHDARRRFTSMATHALPADTVEHFDKLAQWFQLRPVKSRPLDAEICSSLMKAFGTGAVVFGTQEAAERVLRAVLVAINLLHVSSKTRTLVFDVFIALLKTDNRLSTRIVAKLNGALRQLEAPGEEASFQACLDLEAILDKIETGETL